MVPWHLGLLAVSQPYTVKRVHGLCDEHSLRLGQLVGLIRNHRSPASQVLRFDMPRSSEVVPDKVHRLGEPNVVPHGDGCVDVVCQYVPTEPLSL